MRSIITIIFLSCSLLSISQEKPKKDTAVVTDSTLIFSTADLQPLYKELEKLPYATAAPLIRYLEQLLAVKTKEYKARRQK